MMTGKAQEHLDMLRQMLNKQYDAWEFTYDFAWEGSSLADELSKTSEKAADAVWDLIDACGYFDPYNTGSPDTIDEASFRAKAQYAYDEAMQVLGRRKEAV